MSFTCLSLLIAPCSPKDQELKQYIHHATTLGRYPSPYPILSTSQSSAKTQDQRTVSTRLVSFFFLMLLASDSVGRWNDLLFVDISVGRRLLLVTRRFLYFTSGESIDIWYVKFAISLDYNFVAKIWF